MPTIEEFEKALLESKQWAESVGNKEKDVNDIVKTVRKKRKLENNYSK